MYMIRKEEFAPQAPTLPPGEASGAAAPVRAKKVPGGCSAGDWVFR